MNQKFQEKPQSTSSRCQPFTWKYFSGLGLADRLLNYGDILGYSDCYRSLRWCGTRFSTILISTMSFIILDHLENLIPIWKFDEILSVFYLNNLEIFSFIICRLLHHARLDFTKFDQTYQNVNYFPAIIWKVKENKVNREDLRSRCFVSIIVKHPVDIRVTRRPIDRMVQEIDQIFACHPHHNSEGSILKFILRSATRLSSGKTPPTYVLDMTLNNLMMRFQ